MSLQNSSIRNKIKPSTAQDEFQSLSFQDYCNESVRAWFALEAGVGAVTAASEAATAATLLTLPLLLAMPSGQVCLPERSNTIAASALLSFLSTIQTEQTFAIAGSTVSRLLA